MTAAPKNFSFNLTLIDHAIVNALQEALEHIMPEIMSDNHLLELQWLWSVPLESNHSSASG